MSFPDHWKSLPSWFLLGKMDLDVNALLGILSKTQLDILFKVQLKGVCILHRLVWWEILEWL